MPSDDEFMEIITNSNLQDISDASVNEMNVKELHVGIKNLSQALFVITEFIHDFFSSFEEDEVEHPALSDEAILYAKEMFYAAEKFCEEFFENEFDDEDDEDDDEYDDEDEE